MGFQNKTFKRTNVTIDGDLVITDGHEINHGLIAQIQGLQAGVNGMQSLSGTFSQPGTIWNSVANSFVANIVYGCTYGNNVFVAVSAGGIISRSVDYGRTWSAAIANSHGGSNIFDIAFGGGVLVAVGAGGKISRSTDNGVTWSALIANNFAGAANIRAVAYFNGSFMAGDAAGNVSASTDLGLTWGALVATGMTAVYSLSGASVRSVNVWLAGGMNGANIVIFRSINAGAAWAGVYSSAGAGTLFATLASGNGIFVFSSSFGVLQRSTDGGQTWAAATTNPFAGTITVGFGNNTFVGCDNSGNIGYSRDYGANFSLQAGQQLNVPYRVAFGNTTFIMTGLNLAGTASTTLWSSWLSYGKSYRYVPSFQGFGTPSNIVFWWQRPVGSNTIKIWGTLTSGAPTANEARIGLPVGLGPDTTNFLIAGNMGFGFGYRGTAGATYGYGMINDGNPYMTVAFYGADGFIGGIASGELTKINGNQILINGEVFTVWWELPISGWN